MATHKTIASFALLGALTLSGSALAGQVYVCKDAQGQTHFQQVPCGAQKEQVAHEQNYTAASSGFDGGSGNYRGMSNNERFLAAERDRKAQRRYEKRMDRLSGVSEREPTAAELYDRKQEAWRLKLRQRELDHQRQRIGSRGWGNFGKAIGNSIEQSQVQRAQDDLYRR